MHHRYNNHNVLDNIGMMVRQRKYVNRISQLQNYGNGPCQVSYRNLQHHYGNVVHQPNYVDARCRRNHDNAMYYWQFNGNAMPKVQFRGYYENPVPRDHFNNGAHLRYDHVMLDQPLYCARARAIRGSGFEVESLFPHGDPLPEKPSANDCSVKPEWPRARWTHKENPTWQPPVKSRSGEYSGTELIKARGDDVMATKYDGPSTFCKNIRTQPWQLVSATDPHAKIITRNLMSDYSRSDSSDRSSTKSGSSTDWTTSE